MRELMREKGVLESFLKGDPGRKYQLSNAVAYEPLTNYLDVSIKAFPSSPEPPSPGFGDALLLSRLPMGSSAVGGSAPSLLTGHGAVLGTGRSFAVFVARL